MRVVKHASLQRNNEFGAASIDGCVLAVTAKQIEHALKRRAAGAVRSGAATSGEDLGFETLVELGKILLSALADDRIAERCEASGHTQTSIDDQC